MYELTDINTIKKIMSRHGFSFSKALGQNFIINPDICPEMAKLSGITETDGVIEIGAGVGVLTCELAKTAKKVVSIELDSRLIPVLEETLADFPNTEVINGDIMKTDLNNLIKDKFSDCDNVCVCANLPYYITSPVIMLLLESRLPIKSITVMVQKEAADRLCAPVGTRDCGAITVAVEYYSKAVKLFDVERNCFMPSPEVDSSVIRLDIKENPPLNKEDEKFFFKMIKSAFAQRRKTLSNSLSSGMGADKKSVLKALENAGIKQTARAEELTIEQLFKLSKELKEVCISK